VSIGSFCSIAADVEIMLGGNHRTEWVSTFPFRVCFDLPGAYEDGHPHSRGDVVVGHDVWIGRGARILSGVSIGNGAVVAGFSVVARDVRPYAVVAGNPAHELRRRFTDAQIDALQQICWWDWPLSRVLASLDILNAADVDSFIAACHEPLSPIAPTPVAAFGRTH
jgi:acetyltransferase-like isoleucine patch superfamily enzyme